MEVTGSVSGGLIKVIMSGKGNVKSIKIDPSLKEDTEVLEDLIVAAISEAKKNADKLSESEMKSVTGGMPINAAKYQVFFYVHYKSQEEIIH